jgi:hypothetical protein
MTNRTIGLYVGNEWAGAKAFADELRQAEKCAVRVRNGAAFTPDQIETFDAVLVRGDFPAVMAAYPQVKTLDAAPKAEEAASPLGSGDSDPATHNATLDAAPKRGPGRPPKAR